MTDIIPAVARISASERLRRALQQIVPSEVRKLAIGLMCPLGGDIYPALGGDYPDNFAFSSLQSLATNVKGVTVPLSGHWIPEEQPKFVMEQLLKFFGEN